MLCNFCHPEHKVLEEEIPGRTENSILFKKNVHVWSQLSLQQNILFPTATRL